MKEEQKQELKNGDSQIILYQTEDGTTKIEVRLKNETVWMSQQQLTQLYQTSRTNVVEHTQHIFEEEELNKEAACRKFRQVQKKGNRSAIREPPFYNLVMIITLGYRIKSVYFIPEGDTISHTENHILLILIPLCKRRIFCVYLIILRSSKGRCNRTMQD
jgi:hypothetical protein